MNKFPYMIIPVIVALASSCNLSSALGENSPASGETNGVPSIIGYTIQGNISTQAPTTTPTEPPIQTLTVTLFLDRTVEEETRYEGKVEYTCDQGGCWRTGGEDSKAPEYYYFDINADNPEIESLLADIGLPSTPVGDDEEAWKRIIELWAWLYRNAKEPKSTLDESWIYLKSLSYDLKPSHHPSIGDYAKVYARYHVIPWNGCTARALIFSALLYRTGQSPDRIAAAYFKTGDLSIQHFYNVLRSGEHWYYVDPACNEVQPQLPISPANVGCIQTVDYEHPTLLAVLPGSTLNKAMLVR